MTLKCGKVIRRSGHFTKTWDRMSGEVTVEGTSSGINRDGITYTYRTITPLHYSFWARVGTFMETQGIRRISRERKANYRLWAGHLR